MTKMFKFFNPSGTLDMPSIPHTWSQGWCETDDSEIVRIVLKTPGIIEFDPKSALNVLGLEEIQSFGYLEDEGKKKEEKDDGMKKEEKPKMPEVQVVKKFTKIPDFAVMTLYELNGYAKQKEYNIVIKNGWKKDQLVDALISKAKANLEEEKAKDND